MYMYIYIYIYISADPCLALAQAGRRPGSPQVCGFGLLGPRPARSTRHQTLCHCLPKSPRTRCPAAAALCQRLAMSPYRHTPLHPCRGFHNLREARAIRTQNPRVGLYHFATAFPGHREYVALQEQSFASAWPVAILHLEGFKTCAKHGPSRHKTRLWAFTALLLPSQVTANTLPCSSSPLPAPGHVAILHLEGFKTCAKHGPSRHKTRLWAFTALPLLSQVTANTLPCLCQRLGQSPYSIQRVSTVSKRARSTAHHDTKPVCGPLPLCRCLPKSPRTHCPAAAALCQRLASRHTPCM